MVQTASTTKIPDRAGASSPPPVSGIEEHRKLILCFDGTGNTFSGSNADTNVVKLLNKLDRNDPKQFHYYQTGIGTYDVNSAAVDQTWLASIRSSVSQTMDMGFGTGFDAHVMAGYRFLMRYYESGDKIYMFGFSRGAFTAKFLARMIHTVGLLCKGNEEMVPFAYRLYQRYLAGQIRQYGQGVDRQDTIYDPTADHAPSPGISSPPLESQNDATTVPSNGNGHRDENIDEITVFSNTFCRKEQTVHNGHTDERNIKVYFLGMWDCVNSVAVLERKAPKPVPVRGTATYVRHAVAVDERRVKFKAALLAQDVRATANDDSEDIKEVWFPGCHGDVGGGWPASEDSQLDMRRHMTRWQRFLNVWTSRKAVKAAKYIDSGPFQMSDIPLAWMLHEVELVGERDAAAAVKWRGELIHRFKERFQRKKQQALTGFLHDSLAFGYGAGLVKVLFWKFLEWLPFINRWELVKNKWVDIRFPPNRGATRDIPDDAILHESLVWRLENDPTYQPKNNHGGDNSPCLQRNGQSVAFIEPPDSMASGLDHKVYKFQPS